ncbi:P-type conjugative transfer protein TrbG [Nitrosomonas aestuarii]|uniref:P-type conjugative transfer protein TrbG n=1 Tax=Nitrosomonas aestuarii TaxID=52441 RepID=UPI000D2F9419|nr:P-type conjugative transfer protein TrbG [Nitrosomonas aestuarii]PTN07558.1 type IV secretion system protein VirB9 [Nitrosomonas aestuarii]
MKRFIPLTALALLTGIITPVLAGNLTEAYFTGKNPQLTPQEREAIAIAIAKKWQANNAQGVKPVAGTDGSIRFLFGSQQPSIVCAVLQVCDIELQPGEQVNSIHLGDQARWLIEPAITGQGAAEVQHLIIKPLDVGLETSLVVTTNRRTYHMRLRSHRRDFMPRVGFVYPEDALAKWDAIKRRDNRAMAVRQSRVIPETGEYLGNLDFGYSVAGSAVWKPVRVYNDGHKTIIQMPKIMAQTEAPTLLLLNREGGLFKQDDTVMVNYRLQGDRYIVDTVFDQAVLIAGVGGNQSRVTITRGN